MRRNVPALQQNFLFSPVDERAIRSYFKRICSEFTLGRDAARAGSHGLPPASNGVNAIRSNLLKTTPSTQHRPLEVLYPTDAQIHRDYAQS